MRLKILLYIISFLVVQHSIKGQDWIQVSSLPDSFNQTHHSFAFSLNNLGLNIVIDVNPPSTHRQMVATSNLSFFRGSWIADYPDGENYLSLFYSENFTPGGPNYTHFSNKEFDILYQTALSEEKDSVR